MTYLVTYTDKETLEYKQVTCPDYETAERVKLEVEKEGHNHIEILSEQEAHGDDESVFL
ncbi:hypothetical protein [Metabacillus iocasae]|uniref:Uncharacterized protein n=1 Tax=Priestia iocasae TaxID=2291674 RepID=A0ABS2QSK8_9BACI|nr:hypothetical protein [Metabacillus iocasae]MBM7702198.1 hypothetical protein [Metabacillus iocasae]